nr:transposase [Desulfobacula sp.]
MFKCLLLQKWYQIKSDPELESQINDHESFQTFLKLSSQEKSPDHSTFSIFRKRLTREKFDIIVGDLCKRHKFSGL